MAVFSLNDSEKAELKSYSIWEDDCPLALERLVNVHISYYGFDGELRDDGIITVMDALATSVEAIFKELSGEKFPVARILPIQHYQGDDELSMTSNNSSSFNSRRIAGSASFSIHSYGAAIDLNPLQNPFLTIDESKGQVQVHPAEGWQFLNRRNQKPGMVEGVISIFKKHGFTIWGGDWTTPVDYHHFQLPRILAELMAFMEPEDASELFEISKGRTLRTDADYELLADGYQKSSGGFLGRLERDLFD